MTREVSGRVLHCDQPVRIVSRRYSWEDEYEHERVKMLCTECGAELNLAIKSNVGLPSDAA